MSLHIKKINISIVGPTLRISHLEISCKNLCAQFRYQRYTTALTESYLFTVNQHILARSYSCISDLSVHGYTSFLLLK